MDAKKSLEKIIENVESLAKELAFLKNIVDSGGEITPEVEKQIEILYEQFS